MVLFGLATPLSKLVGQDFPVYVAAFIRTALTGVIFLPILLMNYRTISTITKQDSMYLLLIAIIGTVGFTIFLLEGTARLPGVVSSALMSFVPLVTGLGSVAFFSTKFTRKLGLSLILAIAGILIINISQTGGENFELTVTSVLGIMLVLLAIASEATFTLSGKKLSANLNPVLITGLASSIASILLLPVALFQIRGWEYGEVDSSSWIYLLVWALGTLGLGTWIWYSGLKRSGSLNASIFMAVMPLSALFFSYILLNEAFEWIHIAGFAFVLGAIVISQSRGN